MITTAYASGLDHPLLNSTNQQKPGEPKPVRGGPSWVYSDKWAVDAKAAGDADRATMIGPMLAALLEDRFKVKTHRATEERSMYALTVAKGGPKIKPTTPGDCRQFDPAAPPMPQPGQLPVCGSLGMDWNGGNRKLTFAGTTLAEFTRNISSGLMDRFVINQTGLDGQFNIVLEFAPDDSTPGGLSALAWSRRDGATPPTAGSIFKALEELGLKLEAAKAPAEYLVIDQVERPKPDFHIVPAAFVSVIQTQSAKPRYDVASIKPCPPTDGPLTGGARGTAGGTNAAFSPGHFSVPCVTLEQLIYLAYASYGAADGQGLANDYLGSASDATKVKGGPAWVHSNNDRYAIEATAPGVTDRATLMGAMLRTLLEERFKLVIHRDTEEQSMYALRIAKDGLKLQPMKDSDCDDKDPGPPPWAKPPCGFMTNGSAGQNTRWNYVGFKLGFLARQLAGVVGHHVIDETGTTANFTITLTFQNENRPPPPEGAEPVAAAPSIFTALEQQLGLKLEKTTGKHGFIAIDHIERPLPNAPVDGPIAYWYKLYHDKAY